MLMLEKKAIVGICDSYEPLVFIHYSKCMHVAIIINSFTCNVVKDLTAGNHTVATNYSDKDV